MGMAKGFKTGGRVITPEKVCGICGIEKPREAFYMRRGRIHSANCRECEQGRRKGNTVQVGRDIFHKHDWWLRSNYGIGLDDYYWLLEKQKGCCAICGVEKNSRGRRWFDVDHCHATGKVRGLLCSECNHGIGALKDNIDTLQKAVIYLALHGPGTHRYSIHYMNAKGEIVDSLKVQ